MSNQAEYSQSKPTSPTSGFNSLKHVVDTASKAQMTCTIVQVKNVTTNGAVAPIGRVNVLPLVQMIDGIGRTVDHVTVFNLPYVRMTGGVRAVILDPQVGDIGIVVSADRDISAVKQSLKKSPPGSKRAFNISDGIYVGMCLSSQKPTSYVRFVDDTTIEISPDGGTTSIWITPNRIDLGMRNAPHAVATVDGPSTKVFAVISESGPND